MAKKKEPESTPPIAMVGVHGAARLPRVMWMAIILS